MTATILRHKNAEHEPISIHVISLDSDDERALALLDRDLDVIETGEHPPFPYLAAVFSEISATGMTRRRAKVTS